MAEICLDCFNKYVMNGEKQLKEKDVILDDDWCEECREWKPCVVVVKPKTIRGRVQRLVNKIKR